MREIIREIKFKRSIDTIGKKYFYEYILTLDKRNYIRTNNVYYYENIDEILCYSTRFNHVSIYVNEDLVSDIRNEYLRNDDCVNKINIDKDIIGVFNYLNNTNLKSEDVNIIHSESNRSKRSFNPYVRTSRFYT